jgi:hypothetical protein
MKPARAGHTWKPAEDQVLRLLFVLNYSLQEMAKVHGRSEGAILAKAEQLKLVYVRVYVLEGKEEYYVSRSENLFHTALNVYTRQHKSDHWRNR